MDQANSVVGLLVDLIMQPGSSLKLVPVINVSILALLILLACLTYSKIAIYHILIMSSLALGLLLSVNWVYYEIQRADQAKADQKPNASSSSQAAVGDKVTHKTD